MNHFLINQMFPNLCYVNLTATNEKFFGYQYTTKEIIEPVRKKLIILGLRGIKILNGNCRILYYRNSILSSGYGRMYFYNLSAYGDIIIRRQNYTAYLHLENPTIVSLVAITVEYCIRVLVLHIYEVHKTTQVWDNGTIVEIIFPSSFSYMVLVGQPIIEIESNDKIQKKLAIKLMKSYRSLSVAFSILSHGLSFISQHAYANEQSLLKLFQGIVKSCLNIIDVAQRNLIYCSAYNTSMDSFPYVSSMAWKIHDLLDYYMNYFSQQLLEIFMKNYDLGFEIYKLFTSIIVKLGQVYDILHVIRDDIQLYFGTGPWDWWWYITPDTYPPVYEEAPCDQPWDEPWCETPPDSDEDDSRVSAIVVVDEIARQAYTDWPATTLSISYLGVVPFYIYSYKMFQKMCRVDIHTIVAINNTQTNLS